MWHHPATQANVALLRERGVRFAGPSAGRLASGAIGMGRLAPIPDIIWASRASVGARGPLAGKTVVVTAGGTREEIDPVRFIGNGSSGRMGVALVGAALDRGAAVRLIATESVEKSLLPPDSIIVESALELQTAVNEQVETADVLIMTAAVADFRPAMRSDQKVKKQAGQEAWAIDLVRNPDIVAGISRAGLLKVGFAAETENLVENAREKLVAKGLDAIVVNEAVATIGSSRSAATIISVGQEAIVLPELGKDVVADRVMDEVVRLLMVSDA